MELQSSKKENEEYKNESSAQQPMEAENESSRHQLYQSNSKLKTNHDLIIRVFPRLGAFTCNHIEISLAP